MWDVGRMGERAGKFVKKKKIFTSFADVLLTAYVDLHTLKTNMKYDFGSNNQCPFLPSKIVTLL